MTTPSNDELSGDGDGVPAGLTTDAATAERAIVLFDGVCNLCNASVNFIIDRDPNAYFRFASLQSEVGQQLRSRHGLPEAFDSFVLVQAGKAYTRSGAAVRVARRLSGAWKLLHACIVIPPFVRNAVYDLVARNRYRWFGKEDSCRLPSPELQARFLDA